MAVHLVPEPGELIDRADDHAVATEGGVGANPWTQTIVVTRWPVSRPGTLVAIALNAQWAAARPCCWEVA